MSQAVQHYHSMLLAANGYSRNICQAASLTDGFLHRVPPTVWMDLRSARMAGASLPDQGTRLGIADHHLAGLGRTINTCNQRHGIPSVSSAVERLYPGQDSDVRRRSAAA